MLAALPTDPLHPVPLPPEPQPELHRTLRRCGDTEGGRGGGGAAGQHPHPQLSWWAEEGREGPQCRLPPADSPFPRQSSPPRTCRNTATSGSAPSRTTSAPASSLCESQLCLPHRHPRGTPRTPPHPPCSPSRYEDGQVGDANINTQDPKIQKEIMRVIGTQVYTN